MSHTADKNVFKRFSKGLFFVRKREPFWGLLQNPKVGFLRET